MINTHGHGSGMSHFRHIINDDNDDHGMEDILSAFSIHSSGNHGFYGLHHHGMRRHRGMSDRYRLPTRKLTEKDVEILKKSEERNHVQFV